MYRALLGSPGFQFVYDSSVPEGLHFHLPSSSLSVPPIYTALPAAAVISNAFCSADFTVASSMPAFRQACSASSHDRASFISVYFGSWQTYLSFKLQGASFHLPSFDSPGRPMTTTCLAYPRA